jgi:nucleoside-diphosphate-sugar epimerase
MKALVTGASGYIGGHLAEALVRGGNDVSCLVRPTSRTARLRDLPVSLMAGDLRDFASLLPAVRGRDVVFHLAGAISAPSRTAYEEANVQGTGNLLEACLRAAPHLERFVYVSSIAAAGPSPEGEVLDEDAEPRPVSNYGRSKLEAENLVRAACDRLPATILRPPNVLGPGQPELEEAVKMMRRRIVPSLGNGRPRTSLIDVEDLVRALILAAEDPRSVGRTYFVTDGRAYAWRDVVEAVRDELGLRGPVLRVPYAVQITAAWLSEKAARLSRRPPRLTREIVRSGRAYHWIYDGSRFERDLGFRAERSMRDSVRRAVDAVMPGRARRKGESV